MALQAGRRGKNWQLLVAFLHSGFTPGVWEATGCAGTTLGGAQSSWEVSSDGDGDGEAGVMVMVGEG